jgi:hypothetical protein
MEQTMDDIFNKIVVLNIYRILEMKNKFNELNVEDQFQSYQKV